MKHLLVVPLAVLVLAPATAPSVHAAPAGGCVDKCVRKAADQQRNAKRALIRCMAKAAIWRRKQRSRSVPEPRIERGYANRKKACEATRDQSRARIRAAEKKCRAQCR